MKKILSLVMAALLVCVCGTVGAANETEAKNSTGASVMGFSSVNIVTGETVTSDIIGNTTLTLINEWAYWCGPCMSEMPHLQAAHEYYSSTPEADVQIIGCAYDTSIAQGQNVLNSNGYTWVNVMEDTVLGNIFATEGYIPQTIIVDRHGVVRDHIVTAFRRSTSCASTLTVGLRYCRPRKSPRSWATSTATPTTRFLLCAWRSVRWSAQTLRRPTPTATA